MRIYNICSAVSFLLFLAAPATFAVTSDSAPLIPLETLTSAPLFWDPLLSPDGTTISYVALRGDSPNLWVAPASRFQDARPLTLVGGHGVTSSNVAGFTNYRWTADSSRLLYLADQNGDERWHLMVVDVATGVSQDLTPLGNVQVRLVAVGVGNPDEALVEINDRRPDFHDLYRINVRTGGRELIYKNDRFIGFFADNNLIPRVAVAQSTDGGLDLFHNTQQRWRSFLHLRQSDTSALIRSVEHNAWNFSADNRRLRLYDSRARDTWAIVDLDWNSGRTRELASDPLVDVDSPLYDSAGNLDAWRVNQLRSRWRATSPRTQSQLTRLQALHTGDLGIVNRSFDGRWWLVWFTAGDRSPQLFLFDSEGSRLLYLSAQVPSVDQLTLAPLRPIEVKSRDGLRLISYLLLPPGTRVDKDGIPSSPLPMVVYVHGGPNDERASFRFSGRLQWLANRGYAVLDVNYRGSPGFGKRFLNAQNRAWGNAMNQDVVDQVQWAVDSRIAIRTRVGIFGGSYGGYEALVAMTKSPTVFACGAALAAPTDLESFVRIWWENFIPATNMAYKATILGDPNTPEGRLALRNSSPIRFAHQAQGPMLIAQGGQDTRVPYQQAENMVQLLNTHSKPVTYVFYPDEGHGVIEPHNRKSFFAILESFFGHCLGGASLPLTDELRDARVEIRAGAQLVPGLEKAWAEKSRMQHANGH